MTEKVEVIVDGREPEKVFDTVERHDEVSDWHFDILDSADLRIGDVGFERKTIADYAGSMMGVSGSQQETEGRLEPQVGRMLQQYDAAYILLDGDSEVSGDMSSTDNLTYTQVSGKSLRGSMAKVTAHGVPVIPCSNTRLLVDIAVRIGRKHIEDTSLVYLPRGPVDIDKPVAQQMFGCLPHVGVKTAELLYDEFGSVSALVEADFNDLVALDGVGDVMASDIITALHTDTR